MTWRGRQSSGSVAVTRKYVAGFTRGSFPVSRGPSLDSGPPPPACPQAGLQNPTLRNTAVAWAEPGAEALSSPGPGLPPASFLSGRETEERGRSLHTTCSWKGSPTGIRMDSLERGKWSEKGDFAKAELTYLLSRIMHTTISVCLSVRPTSCLCSSQCLSPTSCCNCSSSGQAAQALRLGKLGGVGSLAARCLLGIVVFPALENGSRSCHVYSQTENSKTHIPLRERPPALTDAFFDWSSRLPIFPLSSTISCAEAQRDPPSELN